MIFNFNENFQFTTRLHLENTLLEIVDESKLLGTIVTTDLKWHRNTELIVKKAYSRMQILHKLASFKVSVQDMKEIYILYIRSILEFNCQVWHFSLTDDDRMYIERVQKVACRLILQSEYDCYERALKTLNLESLDSRRSALCLRFAKKCSANPKSASMFPLNPSPRYTLRKPEKFLVQRSRTSRLKYSAIPQMQRLLNSNHN